MQAITDAGIIPLLATPTIASQSLSESRSSVASLTRSVILTKLLLATG